MMFDSSVNAVAERLSVCSNSVTSSVLYMNFKGVIRESNFVENTEDVLFSSYCGVISTHDSGCLLVVEGCYIMKNNCKALSCCDSGTIVYIHCSLDDQTKNGDIQIKDNVVFGENDLRIDIFRDICETEEEERRRRDEESESFNYFCYWNNN